MALLMYREPYLAADRASVMMQYAKYWTKESMSFDDVPLFPYYYVPASSLGSASPAHALV
jgi:hypothetical protein